MNKPIIGPIHTEYHPQRHAQTHAIVYEYATVSRKVEYVEKGKPHTHTLSVSVRGVTKTLMSESPVAYEVNWSAIGSVSPEWATAYAELLNKAVAVAEVLTKAYVK